MKSKKASVPITLLVLGVFTICSLALLTFFISDVYFSNSFVMIEDLRSIQVYEDEWTFYKNQGMTDQQIFSNIKFPTQDLVSDKYSINITLDSNKKNIEITRFEKPKGFYKKVKNLFTSSKNKEKVIFYTIEYFFD